MKKIFIISLLIALFCLTTVYADHEPEHVVRKLARRTRKLVRNVEHRAENRREHSRTRKTIRRLGDRIKKRVGEKRQPKVRINYGLVNPYSAPTDDRTPRPSITDKSVKKLLLFHIIQNMKNNLKLKNQKKLVF